MIRGRSVLADGFAVFGGWVSFILFPVVHREFFVEAIHVFIAIGFSEDGRGCDIEIFPVALDDAGVGDSFDRFESVAVDHEVFRADVEFGDTFLHSEDGGVEYVDFVDGVVANVRDGMAQGLFFN